MATRERGAPNKSVWERASEWLTGFVLQSAARKPGVVHEELGLDDVGPFRPPRDFAFEPELRGPAPRPLPVELQRREVARLRRDASAWGMAGTLLLISAALPLTQHWAVFVPLFGYLSWIGFASLGAAAWLQIRGLFPRVRNRQYIELGMPLVARVRRLWFQPASLQEGEPLTYQFCAIVDYPKGDQGELECRYLVSNEIPAVLKGRFETTYRVGDYATAIRLSEDEFNLYGFLDLKPGLGVVDSAAAMGRSAWGPVGVVAGVFGITAAVAWAFSSIGRYSPIDGLPWRDRIWLIAIGAAPGALGTAAFWRCLTGHEFRRIGRRNAEAAETGDAVELTIRDVDGRRATTRHRLAVMIAAAGAGALFGGIASVGCFYAANALLDASPKVAEEIMIMDLIVTDETFHGLVLYRNFEVAYRFPGDRERHRFTSNPDQMAQLHGQLATATLRKGYLGWRWVEAITP